MCCFHCRFCSCLSCSCCCRLCCYAASVVAVSTVAFAVVAVVAVSVSVAVVLDQSDDVGADLLLISCYSVLTYSLSCLMISYYLYLMFSSSSRCYDLLLLSVVLGLGLELLLWLICRCLILDSILSLLL